MSQNGGNRHLDDALPLRTRAFGLDVTSGFSIPGIRPLPPVGDGRELDLRLAPLAELERDFPHPADRLVEHSFDDGRPAVWVDAAGDLGYMAHAFDFGHARIGADGRTALVAENDAPQWIWQRYLTGQILPLTALLQGLEVFHACVLGLEGRAIAIVANSGVGKTTLALTLALQGLEFVSDDVLVAEPGKGGVIAHPGVGLANVRPPSRFLLPELERQGIASPIGENQRETRIAIDRSDTALPLGVLFLLNRFQEHREVEVERLVPVDPRVLLAATFNFHVRSPERMARQLDICSRIERSAPVYRVSCGGEVEAEAVAEAVLEAASEALAC